MSFEIDEHFIKNCQKGDVKSQRMLYDRFAPKLYGICKRYILDSEEAQDVLQDSFVKIFLNLNQFKGTGSLEGWMCKITVHTAITHYHRHSVFKYDETTEDMTEKIPDTSVQQTDYLSREILMRCIEELPAGYRTVFNMFEIDGFSHEEIAKQLKISKVTSRTQLLKAKKALQQKLESYLKEGTLF